MSEVSLPDVLLEEVGIFLMAKCEMGQCDKPGLIFRVGVVNQMQNMRDGITNDLAFRPAE